MTTQVLYRYICHCVTQQPWWLITGQCDPHQLGYMLGESWSWLLYGCNSAQPICQNQPLCSNGLNCGPSYHDQVSLLPCICIWSYNCSILSEYDLAYWTPCFSKHLQSPPTYSDALHSGLHRLCNNCTAVKTCIKLQWVLVMKPDQWASGVQYEAHGIRCKLNLCVGSPVTVAYRVLDNELESSQRLSRRWTETLHQAMWITWSEYEKEPEYMMS